MDASDHTLEILAQTEPVRKTQRQRRQRNWRKAFLHALQSGATIARACLIAGISRSQAYRWKGKNPQFAVEWDAAEKDGWDLLEEVVRSAALNDESPNPSVALRLLALHDKREEKRASLAAKSVSSEPASEAAADSGRLDLSRLTEEELVSLEQLIKKATATSEGGTT